MLYIHRQIEATLNDCLHALHVVGISGPRQVGKTTLLRRFLKDYTYVSFDDFRVMDLFHKDPQQFIAMYKNKVIFDEVQKAPAIFNALKSVIEHNGHGKFVLVSSCQFDAIKGINESLSEQIAHLSLLPFQYMELPKSFREESIFRGAYPELVNQKYQLANDWYSSYLEVYFNKDITTLGHVSDMTAFRRLIQMLAGDVGQVLNLSTYAAELGLEVKTIKRWIGLLEASYLIFLLPAFYKDYGKRLIKSPKIYFYDTGLVSFLMGIETKSSFEKSPMADRLFENYLVIEVLKKELHHKTGAKLFYLQTNHGVEVSLIIDREKYKELIIVENATVFNPKKLDIFEQFIGKNDKGYLLYRGEKFPATHIEIIHYKDYLLQV